MIKNVAPLKSTGGGGYVFEDKVAAFFLACLLSEEPPLDPHMGVLTQIDFQTRVDGWYLDDLLLTLSSTNGVRRCAISVKSNQQFSKDSAPSEFVIASWAQFLHEGTDRFNQETDVLGLVLTPLPPDFAAQLNELLAWARAMDPVGLSNRLPIARFGSDTKRNLFNSFACPPGLAQKHNVDDKTTGMLLRSVQIIQHDFELSPSTQLQQAVRHCRNMLRSGSLDEAQELWEHLLYIASENRPYAGSINRLRLLNLLRSRFDLKELPTYDQDWKTLTEHTRTNLAVIPDTIGNSVTLPRPTVLTALDATFTSSTTTVLLGPSGCGKTVIAKLWSEQQRNQAPVVWWNGRSFQAPDFTTFVTRLGLRHALTDILSNVSAQRGYVIIDDVSRIFGAASFEHLSNLIQALQLSDATSPWRLLLTCQLEEWDRVQIELARVNVNTHWQPVIMDTPSADELEIVWQAFPALQPLLTRKELQPVLHNPKILDLLATRWTGENSIDVKTWVGESDIIEWFWRTEVSKPPQQAAKTAFLKRLAARQADELRQETPTDEIPVAEQAVVDDLIRDGICQQRDERLTFQHDLYGDWSRQRVLLGHAQDLGQYLESRVTLSLWHRAVRLYALHLLEQNTDLDPWRAAIGRVSATQQETRQIHDLLLEAVIFVAAPLPLLEQLWPDLADRKGILLQRLLVRFLYIATLPNPQIVEIATIVDESSVVKAATIDRIPYRPYWEPILQFLHAHFDAVLDLVPFQVAEITGIWLLRGAPDWPFRNEAAELAIALAERMRIWKGQGILINKLDRLAYRAALAGAYEFPERVAAFALEATARRQTDPTESEPQSLANVEVRPVYEGYQFAPQLPPWPDGPLKAVDTTFQDLCLDTDALYPLILTQPEIAREVVLALLIEHPRARLFRSSIDAQVGVLQRQEWWLPLYTRGPFLFFLKHQPAQGLDLVIQLVNFATTRWTENPAQDGQAISSVRILLPTGEQTWYGDDDVYYWYRSRGHCPYPIVVALMALEKWLYDEMDAQRSIEPTLEILLQQSNSVAFAGLLSAVGCKAPMLFATVLRPLLAVREFNNWEWKYSLESHDYLMLGWGRNSDVLGALAHEWHTLPHRKQGIHKWAQFLFLNNPEMRPFFEQTRATWLIHLNTMEEGSRQKDEFEQLIALFNLDNYVLQQGEEQQAYWQFSLPNTLQTKTAEARRTSGQALSLLQLAFNCRECLDGNTTLRPEDREMFWQILQQTAALSSPLMTERGALNTEHAVCGGIAVLLLQHRQWLQQYSDREQWCVEELIDTIRNPPQPETLDFEESYAPTHWDRFCGQVVPMLWAENPDSLALRECVALLAANHHYEVVRMLFTAAAKYRHTLGDEFQRLQHLLLRLARSRWQWQYNTNVAVYEDTPLPELPKASLAHRIMTKIRHFLSGSESSPQGRNTQDQATEQSDQVRPLLQDFVDKRLSPEIPTWEHITTTWRTDAPRTQPHHQYGLDFLLLRAGYAWMPTLDMAADEAERAAWIAFWHQALTYLLSTLRNVSDEEEEAYRFDLDWGGWIIDRVVILIMQLRADEQPTLFWQPILALGPAGRAWIEHFLTSWFLYGLRTPSFHEAFVQQWRAIVTWAFTSPTWNERTERRWYDLSALWSSIMGFGRSIIRDQWSEALQPIVLQMYDIYEQWAAEHLNNPSCVQDFVAFLREPAAVPLRIEALLWLASVANQQKDTFWNKGVMQDGVASILVICWQQQQVPLRQKQASFNAFNQLLQALADRQHALALELQDRMGR